MKCLLQRGLRGRMSSVARHDPLDVSHARCRRIQRRHDVTPWEPPPNRKLGRSLGSTAGHGWRRGPASHRDRSRLQNLAEGRR